MKITIAILFSILCLQAFAQKKHINSELWLETSSGKKLDGVYSFKKKPTVQDTLALNNIISVKIVSTNEKSVVKYIMLYQFRNGKDVFIGESEDKSNIVLQKYNPQKGDLFVVQVALKDKMEKQFCFMVE